MDQWIFIRLYNTWFDENLQKGRPVSELKIPENIKNLGKKKLQNSLIQKDLHTTIMPRYGGARAAGLSVPTKKFSLTDHMRNAATGSKRKT